MRAFIKIDLYVKKERFTRARIVCGLVQTVNTCPVCHCGPRGMLLNPMCLQTVQFLIST